MRLSRNGLAHRVSARRRTPKMSRVVFLPHSAFLRPDMAWPSGCRVVPDTATSRNTRSCLLGPQRRNGEPAPRRRHRMWGSVTSVLTCPLFSPLVLTLPHHTHKHTNTQTQRESERGTAKYDPGVWKNRTHWKVGRKYSRPPFLNGQRRDQAGWQPRAGSESRDPSIQRWGDV